MPGDNVEVVRAAFRCFNEGDWDALAELYEPDAVGVGPEGWPETVAEGRDAVVDQFRRLAGEGVESQAELEEAIEHDGAVVVRIRWRITGAATGLSQENRLGGCFRLNGARIADVRFFWDFADALAEAGLRD